MSGRKKASAADTFARAARVAAQEAHADPGTALELRALALRAYRVYASTVMASVEAAERALRDVRAHADRELSRARAELLATGLVAESDLLACEGGDQ